MEQSEEGSASTSKEAARKSLTYEAFKGEFTNAIWYALSIYESHGLITTAPPGIMSSVSLPMGEKIRAAVLDIINEYDIAVEEDLILYHKSDEEGLSEELPLNTRFLFYYSHLFTHFSLQYFLIYYILSLVIRALN